MGGEVSFMSLILWHKHGFLSSAEGFRRALTGPLSIEEHTTLLVSSEKGERHATNSVSGLRLSDVLANMHGTLVLGELTGGSRKSHHLNPVTNVKESTTNEVVQKYLKLDTVMAQYVFVQVCL